MENLSDILTEGLGSSVSVGGKLTLKAHLNSMIFNIDRGDEEKAEATLNLILNRLNITEDDLFASIKATYGSSDNWPRKMD